MNKIILISLLLITSCVQGDVIENKYYIQGIAGIDDTVILQNAFTYCSINEVKCVIPKNKKALITSPLYIWGNTSLIGEHGAEIQLNVFDLTQRYVINLGISGVLQPEQPFVGKIKGVTFRAITGPLDKWQEPNRTPIAGHIIQCWKCKHTTIKKNVFEIGEYFYKAIATQVDGAWMFGLGIKHNITISHNTINQNHINTGIECINAFKAQDITIKGNTCTGSGDDLIGLHFVDGAVVKDNILRGVDGRIFCASCTDTIIKGNHIERMASLLDGQWYKGVALIYVGYEHPAAVHDRPHNIIIKNNVLILPEGSIDGGAVINIRGAGDIMVKDNIIRNDSMTNPHGVWVAPWQEPGQPSNYEDYYIKDVSIVENKFNGTNPLKIIQTDQCIGYQGFVDIINNLGEIGRLSCPSVVNEYGNI